MVPEITSKYYHMNVILCLLTVELDAAISVPQRVLGDALVRSEVCWTDGTDRQFHVYFVGVVQQYRLVLATCEQQRKLPFRDATLNTEKRKYSVADTKRVLVEDSGFLYEPSDILTGNI